MSPRDMMSRVRQLILVWAKQKIMMDFVEVPCFCAHMGFIMIQYGFLH